MASRSSPFSSGSAAKSAKNDRHSGLLGAAETFLEEVEEAIESVVFHRTKSAEAASSTSADADQAATSSSTAAADRPEAEASGDGDAGSGSGKSLRERWREIQGLNHWEGLLDPLDPELRKSILFYGDFNQAVYDSFETDEHSKYTGSCR
jgi:hypothetical protein